MARFFPALLPDNLRTMVFVDGENLAIRYKHLLKENKLEEADHVRYEPDIYVWSIGLNNILNPRNVIRKYYYTSVEGDQDRITDIHDQLIDIGIENPKVFKKMKSRGSKQVDISLATDMLTHASRKNFNLAILIAGDGDYVPLIKAVKLEGLRIYAWFFENGLSPILRRSVDRFTNIGGILLSPNLKTHLY